MKNIVLTECYDILWIDEDGGDKTITTSQAIELANFVAAQNLKQEYIVWGNKSIKFLNYVGYIQCSTFSIEILPKITFNNDFIQMRKVLIDMLSECGYINVNTSDMAPLDLTEGTLFEIFGRIYADALYLELNKGIATQYQQVENNLRILKGSLIIPKQITENLSRNKNYMAYCEYEERTIDHELNRVFKVANQLLLKNIKNAETQKLLKQINHLLDGVSVKLFTKKQLLRIKLDRMNKRFDTPFLLAKQFLMNVTANFSANKENSFSLLFEMNDLFEKYIATLIKKITQYRVYEQHNKHRLLVKENNNRDIFQLKPDIVVENESTQIIIDTKWKLLTSGNRSGVKREDLFQMYAYLTRYEHASSAILLYPQQITKDDNRQIESWYLHADTEKKLRVYEVSLGNKKQTLNELLNILHINGVN